MPDLRAFVFVSIRSAGSRRPGTQQGVRKDARAPLGVPKSALALHGRWTEVQKVCQATYIKVCEGGALARGGRDKLSPQPHHTSRYLLF